MKPLDESLIEQLALSHQVLVTIEEGSSGGFGDAVVRHLNSKGLLDAGALRVRSMVIPDIWIEQGPQKDQYDIAGLNEPHIVEKVAALAELVRTSQRAAHQIKTATESKEELEAQSTLGAVMPAVIYNVPYQQKEESH